MNVLIGSVVRILTLGFSCRRLIVAVCLLGVLTSLRVRLQAEKRPFTVGDDVALSHFGTRTSFDDDSFVFSPDHRLFAVYTEDGRLDLNRPEAILRVYRAEDIIRVLKERESTHEPSPVWEIRQSTYRHGPIVTRLRWLRDSSGVAFLAKTASGNNRLLLADLRTKVIHKLTGDDQYVTSFDIKTEHNLVYTALAQRPSKQIPKVRQSVIIGTGRDLFSLLFPDDSRSPNDSDRSELWAVVGGHRFKMKDPATGRTLTIYPKELSLSPDGQSVVTVLPVEMVPAEWERLYPPPPLPWASFRVRAGRQDLEDPQGFGLVEEYDLIDLRSGQIRRLVDAPSATSAAWWAWPSADWSSDGRLVALSGAFVGTASPEPHSLSRPCVVVIDIGSLQSTCLESIHGSAEDDRLKWHIVTMVRFAPGSDSRLTVSSFWPGDQYRSTTYTRESSSYWRQDTPDAADNKQEPFGLSIKQDLNSPPILLATDNSSGISIVVWNPNPQLGNVALGDVSIFRWKGQSGQEDIGGLFKPPDYVPGRRYPLVIQNHGFIDDQFIPSGAFPTAFAAQELAAIGIVVLQIRGEACPPDTPEEARCAAADYEAAASALVKAGIADPDKLGIIGFSRTCYYVLEELTAGTLHFKAASITDGVDYGYFQYFLSLDSQSNLFAKEADAIIGAPPFGEGLTLWAKRSSEFKMDRVETPLQVVGLDNHQSLLSMWQAYANLRYLHKPVDLTIIPDSEHVLTNPRERMISQGGTVDWFRFWLKGEEDPDPHKAQQYVRWRELRQRQEKVRSAY